MVVDQNKGVMMKLRSESDSNMETLPMIVGSSAMMNVIVSKERPGCRPGIENWTTIQRNTTLHNEAFRLDLLFSSHNTVRRLIFNSMKVSIVFIKHTRTQNLPKTRIIGRNYVFLR